MPWLRLCSWYDCARHPIETARAIREYIVKSDALLARADALFAEADTKIAQLKRECDELEADNKRLRASHGLFLVRGSEGRLS